MKQATMSGEILDRLRLSRQARVVAGDKQRILKIKVIQGLT